MPQSYLIFDFGANEPAAQQARHRLEGWRQAFRLDRKLQLKFERTALEDAAAQEGTETPGDSAEANSATAKSEKGKEEKAKTRKAKGARTNAEKSKGQKPKAEAKQAEESKGEEASNQHIRLIVRLDFSDHERLSHHRWLERIPIEGPFKDASPKVIRQGEEEFGRTADFFDSLS